MKLEIGASPAIMTLTPETKDEWKLLVCFEGGLIEMPQFSPGGALHLIPRVMDLSNMQHLPDPDLVDPKQTS